VRICSFLPSATEIVAELGLIDSLVGVSAECRWPHEVVGKPVVTAASFDPALLGSAEIDAAVRSALSGGESLYLVDEERLAALAPDVIVTQDLCAVCAVSSDAVSVFCPPGVEIVSLDPRTLGDVMDSVLLLASRLGAVERGEEVVLRMRETIADAARSVSGLPRRRVFFAEWIDPPFTAGHWLPEMVDLAGGKDVLGRSAEPSRRTSWDEVVALEPELVVVGPCGFGVEEAAARAAGLELPCPAIAVDGDSYYSRPAPRLADGLRQLAYLFHPEYAADPGLPAVSLGGVAAA
jgi:iron complex transport system substrate-binding protein